jgi:hypothetical protein
MSQLTKYEYMQLAAIALNSYKSKFSDQDKIASELVPLAYTIVTRFYL